jgi:hypothetical protein
MEPRWKYILTIAASCQQNFEIFFERRLLVSISRQILTRRYLFLQCFLALYHLIM